MSTYLALLVTAPRLSPLGPAYVDAAQRGLPVSPIMPAADGRSYTFMVLPQTTAEQTAEQTAARAAFRAALNEANTEAGHTVLEWVEIEYGAHAAGGRVRAHVPPTPPVIDEDDDEDDLAYAMEEPDDWAALVVRSRLPRYDERNDEEEEEETFTRH